MATSAALMNIDFSEIHYHFRILLEGKTSMRDFEPSVFNESAINSYTACIAYPEPMGDLVYEETGILLTSYMEMSLEYISGSPPFANSQPNDELLKRYETAWLKLEQTIVLLAEVYTYLQLQETHGHKVRRLAMRQWRREVVKPLESVLTERILYALGRVRQSLDAPATVQELTARNVIISLSLVCAFGEDPMILYYRMVESPYLDMCSAEHTQRATQLRNLNNVSMYVSAVLQGHDKEQKIVDRMLFADSYISCLTWYEKHMVVDHLPYLYSNFPEIVCEIKSEDVMFIYRLMCPLRGKLGPIRTSVLRFVQDKGVVYYKMHVKRHIRFVEKMMGRAPYVSTEVMGQLQLLFQLVD